MAVLNLNQLGIYNPQRLNDDVVEKIFIARKKLFEFIFKKISSEKSQSIPQHHIIMGQRGMGKSTLLKRTEVELRKVVYASSFIPVLYPEEQYNLKDLAEFWLNTLDAIADTLEIEKQSSIVKQIDDKVAQLSKIKVREDLCKATYDYFKEICQMINRRPVLLIDNMNLLFDRMDESEQYKLRAWITQKGAPIILGASAVNIKDTKEYGAPFYDAFQFHYLKRLEFNELLEILKNLATLTDTPSVQHDLYQNLARLRTIHQLTGGNPRTVVMLFKLLIKGFSQDINDDLEALLDEITPLYKAKFEELPEQLQIIVDAIALYWDPISLEQLRAETGYENNQLSPQLKRLIDIGWIEKQDAYYAKGSAYQINERFFNIWFLMRRSSRRQKKELYCLSKFLETYYGEDLHDIAQQRIGRKSQHLNSVYYDLALAEVVKEDRLKYQLKIQAHEDLKELSKFQNIPFSQIPIDDVNATEINEKRNKLVKLLNSNDYEKIEHNSLELISLVPSNTLQGNEFKASLYNILGNIYSKNFEQLENAEKMYLKALELDKNSAIVNYNLGLLYHTNLQSYEKAKLLYLNAIKLDKKFALAYNNLGNLFQEHFQRFEEAEKMYLKAIDIDDKETNSYYNLGNLYQIHFQRFEEAEKMYLKAISIDEKFALAYYNLGVLYQVQLQRDEEAEKMYLKALELEENNINFYFSLGNLYQTHFQRFEEAEKMYLKAIELDGNNMGIYNSLGNLYQDYLHQYNKAETIYNKGLLITPTHEYLIFNLVFLYRDKLKEFSKAQKLFDTLNEEPDLKDSYWLNVALFELYKKNEGLAREAILKAIECVDDSLPANTEDDWWRFAAVVHELGKHTWWLEIMEYREWNIKLAPFYIAMRSLMDKSPDDFIMSKAVEFRESSQKIMQKILSFVTK